MFNSVGILCADCKHRSRWRDVFVLRFVDEIQIKTWSFGACCNEAVSCGGSCELVGLPRIYAPSHVQRACCKDDQQKKLLSHWCDVVV